MTEVEQNELVAMSKNLLVHLDLKGLARCDGETGEGTLTIVDTLPREAKYAQYVDPRFEELFAKYEGYGMGDPIVDQYLDYIGVMAYKACFDFYPDNYEDDDDEVVESLKLFLKLPKEYKQYYAKIRRNTPSWRGHQ